jgi:hypothetical protein
MLDFLHAVVLEDAQYEVATHIPDDAVIGTNHVEKARENWLTHDFFGFPPYYALIGLGHGHAQAKRSLSDRLRGRKRASFKVANANP